MDNHSQRTHHHFTVLLELSLLTGLFLTAMVALYTVAPLALSGQSGTRVSSVFPFALISIAVEDLFAC